MPYLILSANGEELERRELPAAVTVGRSSECEVAVRDILLSRKHCRVEPCTGKDKGRWRLVDLDSRNGCHVNWKKVTEYTLVDRDAVRIGRTWLTFRAGKFEPAPAEAGSVIVKKNKLVRPADPHEALAGTMADFVFVERDANGEEFDGTPSPTTPTRRSDKKKVAKIGSKHSPMTGLSSGLDSMVATATQGTRRMARPIPRKVGASSPSAQARANATDLSLQADAAQIPFLEVVPTLPRRRSVVPALILTAGLLIATAMVLVSGWIMARG